MTDMYRSTADADVALVAARAGADVVRGMHGRRLGRMDKDAGDFATEADIAAEQDGHDGRRVQAGGRQAAAHLRRTAARFQHRSHPHEP
ncbi:hypothetical protein ACFY4H_01365 [Streptomyces althioticus]|uniref:hypothetical protein n=1 Tax=Streptomyces althioticus TaxID=83380 RepID=UPI00368447E8